MSIGAGGGGVPAGIGCAGASGPPVRKRTIGRSSAYPTAFTPGRPRRRSATSSEKGTEPANADERTVNVRRWAASYPGSTLASFTKLCTNSPPPTSAIVASAVCVTSSAARPPRDGPAWTLAMLLRPISERVQVPCERKPRNRQESDEQADTEGDRDGEYECGPIDLNLFEPRDADAWRQVPAGETACRACAMLTRYRALTAPRPLHRASPRAGFPSAHSAPPSRDWHQGQPAMPVPGDGQRFC